MIFKKINPTKTKAVAAIDSKSKYALVSSGKKKALKVVQKNALSPNALSGNAVAVPLWFGQFVAQTFNAALKAVQLAIPVIKLKKQSSETPMLPAP